MLVATVAGTGAAATIDFRARRIPNAITVLLAAVGLVLAATGMTDVSLGSAMLGFVLGLLLMLPGHALGATGAGDVKLLAAVGTVIGGGRILNAFFYTAIAGGVLAVAFAIYRRRLGRTFRGAARLLREPGRAKREIDRDGGGNRFPYGPAIAVGSVLAALGL